MSVWKAHAWYGKAILKAIEIGVRDRARIRSDFVDGFWIMCVCDIVLHWSEANESKGHIKLCPFAMCGAV